MSNPLQIRLKRGSVEINYSSFNTVLFESINFFSLKKRFILDQLNCILSDMKKNSYN